MGTINYGTSNYITMGLKPYNSDDFLNDADFMEYCKTEGLNAEEEAQEYCVMYTDDDAENVENTLEKYSFYYFHVAIKNGYYEGFYIDIENNFPVFFDDYMERKEAIKEVREIQNFLTDLANIGIVSVYPGWCTKYADRLQTLKDIREATKEMRQEIRNTPTWRQYNKELTA